MFSLKKRSKIVAFSVSHKNKMNICRNKKVAEGGK